MIINKTIQQHLQDIEDPLIRQRALHNMWWEDAGTLKASLADAIYQGFNWSRSPEKFPYWYNVYKGIKMQELMQTT